jgi:hypothetical protein
LQRAHLDEFSEPREPVLALSFSLPSEAAALELTGSRSEVATDCQQNLETFFSKLHL